MHKEEDKQTDEARIDSTSPLKQPRSGANKDAGASPVKGGDRVRVVGTPIEIIKGKSTLTD